jgi:hypothetical protein
MLISGLPSVGVLRADPPCQGETHGRIAALLVLATAVSINATASTYYMRADGSAAKATEAATAAQGLEPITKRLHPM